MWLYDRRSEPPPTYLRGPVADEARRMLLDYFRWRVERRTQSAPPQARLDLQDPSIRDALSRLFHGKCAFCEARVPTETYRFRPSTEAAPIVSPHDPHLYYVWMANAWNNLYPVCAVCRPARSYFFPVRGKRAPIPDPAEIQRYADEGTGLWRSDLREQPLLLDPCATGDVGTHLHVHLDGTFRPLDDVGRATIENFQLNHPDRTIPRAERFATYLEALASARGAPRSDPTLDLFDPQALEFGGAWILLLRRIAFLLAGSRRRTRTPPSRLRTVLLRSMGEQGFHEALAGALSVLSREDAGEPPVLRVETPRTGSLRLDAVQVTNFKALASVALRMPRGATAAGGAGPQGTPALLVLGENAAGKSSILEAIALTLASPSVRDLLELRPAALVLNPELLGDAASDHPSAAAIAVHWDDGSTLGLDITSGGFRETRPHSLDLPPVFAYGAFRQYLQRSRRRTGDRHVRSLFHTDTILANPEVWLLSLPRDRFEMVVRALRPILSIEGEFDVIRRDRRGRRCLVVEEADTPRGRRTVETPLTLASSGFRAVLAMVCDIMHGLMDPDVHAGFETLTHARAVVLIDEVEAHLHPRWKMQIMRGLREALPNVTFIATTHDPLCLRGMNDGEVVVLQRVVRAEAAGEGTQPVFVEALVELPAVSRLTVEQLLTSDFFQLTTTEAPEMERELAHAAELHARMRDGQHLAPGEARTLARLDADIAAALPVGSSEVHRLVQEAVAEFLALRRNAPASVRDRLREATRTRIRDALLAAFG